MHDELGFLNPKILVFLVLDERTLPVRRASGSWHLEKQLAGQEIKVCLAQTLCQKVSMVFF